MLTIKHLTKKIEMFRRENNMQSVVICQLKKLHNSTPKIPHCVRLHPFCKVDHVRYSVFNPKAVQVEIIKTKSLTCQAKPNLTGTNNVNEIKKILRKIDMLQFDW